MREAITVGRVAASSGVRFYDPATGQFLTRDPANAMTRSAYGYVGGNPLNATDPSGLCWGPGCWVESAVKGAVKVATELSGADTETTSRAQGAVEPASDRVGTSITDNPVSDHLGVDASVCGFVCVGLTYQHGHFYLIYGLGALAGAGIGPTYYSRPLDSKSCDNNPSIGGTAGAISGSVSRNIESGGVDAGKGWTVGYSYGIPSLFLGPLWQKPVT